MMLDLLGKADRLSSYEEAPILLMRLKDNAEKYELILCFIGIIADHPDGNESPLAKMPDDFKNLLHQTFSKVYEGYFLKQNIIEANERLEERVQQRTRELNESVEELKKTQTKLLQQEKMAVLGEMSGGIAHEINNPSNHHCRTNCSS
jgi:predicted ribosome quality control (RQC) complex YloA/Tae2 family protein